LGSGKAQNHLQVILGCEPNGSREESICWYVAGLG
jgi:hypothetical protein